MLSPLAQRRHRFTVGKLPDQETLFANPLRDARRTTRSRRWTSRSPSGWTSRSGCPPTPTATAASPWTPMAGERTLDMADKYALSAGRISQMRTQFHDSWTRFQEAPAA